MERQQFLLRFIFLDSRSCVSDAQYLVDVPASISLDEVKHEIARCHDELHLQAKYVESLDFVEEAKLTEDDKKMMADAEQNNPYLFAPELPDGLLRHVCEQRTDWNFSRAQGYFNLSDGTWTDK